MAAPCHPDPQPFGVLGAVSHVARCIARRGHTALEIVVGAGILSILAAAVYGVVSQTVRHHVRVADDLASLQRTSKALDRVKSAVRQAREVRLGAEGCTESRLVLVDRRGRHVEFEATADGWHERVSADPASDTLLLPPPVRVSFRYSGQTHPVLVDILLEVGRGDRPPLRLVSTAGERPRK